MTTVTKELKVFFNKLMEKISVETESIDMDDCNISIEEAFRMCEIIQNCVSGLREYFIKLEPLDESEEITFFKKTKPVMLSKLIYFSKIYDIEIKRPNGSNEILLKYYKNELNHLTHFFNRNLDFYQYYRSNSTHLDSCYFVRGSKNIDICHCSSSYANDPLFSTSHDYLVAKIFANDMLCVYLNKKMNSWENQMTVEKNRQLFPNSNMKWTGSKIWAIELGYALHASRVVNRGQMDVKEIMTFIENYFNIDLRDYYRSYITIKGRKKDRTVFLNLMIESLNKKMDEDDSMG